MICTLMHKNIPVVDMEILSDTGRIVKLSNLQTPERLPLGINTKAGLDRKAMDDWWTSRSIPASRDGIRDALSMMDDCTTALLVLKCYGLSLSDQYWVKPDGSELNWEDINFFENDFSTDVGEMLFGHEPKNKESISLISPDNTSDGWLRKKWIICDNKRMLMKGGSGVFEQEPFNEVFAAGIMKRLRISHVAYSIVDEGEKTYSLCENFITANTELIPASYVIKSMPRSNEDSAFTHLLRCCDTLGIQNVRSDIDKMLALDYIIANEDRHYHNFGFIRNANTLEWYGMAPVYDSGTSLWHNTQSVGKSMPAKPFKKTHEEQIKLVEDWSWFKKEALKGIYEECVEILSQSKLINEERRYEIANAVTERISELEKSIDERPSLINRLGAYAQGSDTIESTIGERER